LYSFHFCLHSASFSISSFSSGLTGTSILATSWSVSRRDS
jgi:hypothetical protein